MGVVAFPRHRYPALQLPAGADRPGMSQYIPGKHDRQSSSDDTDVLGLKVPVGNSI